MIVVKTYCVSQSNTKFKEVNGKADRGMKKQDEVKMSDVTYARLRSSRSTQCNEQLQSTLVSLEKAPV